MNFNILSSEEYQLSDSENAFIYATFLKMSEMTKFKLPKVTSFITVTEDVPNIYSDQLTWATRLDMIY